MIAHHVFTHLHACMMKSWCRYSILPQRISVLSVFVCSKWEPLYVNDFKTFIISILMIYALFLLAFVNLLGRIMDEELFYLKTLFKAVFPPANYI